MVQIVQWTKCNVCGARQQTLMTFSNPIARPAEDLCTVLVFIASWTAFTSCFLSIFFFNFFVWRLNLSRQLLNYYRYYYKRHEWLTVDSESVFSEILQNLPWIYAYVRWNIEIFREVESRLNLALVHSRISAVDATKQSTLAHIVQYIQCVSL